MSRVALIFMQVLVLMAGPLIIVLSADPIPGEPVLVIAPLKQAGFATLVENAGGYQIGPRNAPLATLAASPDPEFAAQLHTAGAWLVVDGGRIAYLCGI